MDQARLDRWNEAHLTAFGETPDTRAARAVFRLVSQIRMCGRGGTVDVRQAAQALRLAVYFSAAEQGCLIDRLPLPAPLSWLDGDKGDRLLAALADLPRPEPYAEDAPPTASSMSADPRSLARSLIQVTADVMRHDSNAGLANNAPDGREPTYGDLLVLPEPRRS